MNIEVMKAFLKTAEKKSLNKAAADINLSQSALSKQIMYIEEYFGQKLLQRSYLGVQLTKEGDFCKQYFYRILELFNELEDVMKADKTPVIGAPPEIGLRLHTSAEKKQIAHDIYITDDIYDLISQYNAGNIDVLFCESSYRSDIEGGIELTAGCGPIYAVLPRIEAYTSITEIEQDSLNHLNYIYYDNKLVIKNKCISNTTNETSNYNSIGNSKYIHHIIEFISQREDYYTLVTNNDRYHAENVCFVKLNSSNNFTISAFSKKAYYSAIAKELII